MLDEFWGTDGVAFNGTRRSQMFVVDSYNDRVQIFSSDDGSFLSSFGEFKKRSASLRIPVDIAVLGERQRLLVADSNNHQLQVMSLDNLSMPIYTIGKLGPHAGQFKLPQAVAFDSELRRIVVADSGNHRIQVLSSLEGHPLLFVVGSRGTKALEFGFPRGVAVDTYNRRIIVADTDNDRLQVLSASDGTFLFQFGERGERAGQLRAPWKVCVDKHSRIIVADHDNERLQAFTPDGRHLATFDCRPYAPEGVAFDERRGIIAYTAANRVFAIEANQWLPGTYEWTAAKHQYAPKHLRAIVYTMISLHILAKHSDVARITKRLLFAILGFL